jgi:hypothetical protein
MIPEEELDNLFHSTIADVDKVDRLQKLIDMYDENESDYLDWKVEEPKNKPLWAHLASMSYRGHGYIIIGVSDDGDICGVDKDKIKGMIKSIEDTESSGSIGVYSWNGDKKIKDVVKVYPRIHVTQFPPPHPSLIPDEVYLQVFEVISGSAFIWSGKLDQPVFWMRGGSSSLGPYNPNTKEFLDKVIEKYERGEKQRKTQECFDTLMDHVRNAAIYNVLKPDNEIAEMKGLRARLARFDDELLNEMRITCKTSGETPVSVDLNDETWHIPYQIHIALWGGVDSGFGIITKVPKGDGSGIVTSLSEIRSFFVEYARSLTNRFHFKIEFDGKRIPLERDVVKLVLSDEKIRSFVFHHQNFNRETSNVYAETFVEFISRRLPVSITIQNPNDSNRRLQISDGSKMFEYNNDDIKIIDHVNGKEKVNSVFQGIPILVSCLC